MHQCFQLVEAFVFNFVPAVVNEMEKTLSCLIQQCGTQGAVKVPDAFRQRRKTISLGGNVFEVRCWKWF